MSRALGAAALAMLSACATPASEPAAVAADAALRPAAEAILRADVGADVRWAAGDSADVVVTLDGARAEALEAAGWTLSPDLVRVPLVAVGPAGAVPAPSLAAALAGRRVALAPAGTPLGDLSRAALGSLDGVLDAPLETVDAADPAAAVAAGEAGAGLAFAPQALAPTGLAVTLRLDPADAPPPGVRVAVRPGAPPAASAAAEALAAPEAFRLWATYGFSPPAR